MKVAPLRPKLVDYLRKHNLVSKFEKQIEIFKLDPRHPSLHNELLEPKERGIRSFRIDLSYRVLFIYDQENNEVEILAITQHYR